MGASYKSSLMNQLGEIVAQRLLELTGQTVDFTLVINDGSVMRYLSSNYDGAEADLLETAGLLCQWPPIVH